MRTRQKIHMIGICKASATILCYIQAIFRTLFDYILKFTHLQLVEILSHGASETESRAMFCCVCQRVSVGNKFKIDARTEAIGKIGLV